MNPKVSVIMPVFGVEEWVGRAIESVLAQTLPDFEFFVVDDGSPDASGDICDSYAAKDSRIQVIHRENGGAATARNLALTQASGDYYFFMDADDWAEPDMLETMVGLAQDHDLELTIAAYFIDHIDAEGKTFTQCVGHDDIIYPTREAFRKDAYTLFDENLLYTPWNKLYSGDYIRRNGLTFPDTFWDDFPFNLSVLRDVERVGVTSRAFYHFIRARGESETAKYRPEMYEKREEENAWMHELYGHWGIDDENSREFIARRYIERVVGCIENVTNPACALSVPEKKQSIANMIDTPQVAEALALTRPRSFMMKLMLLPLRMKSAGLAYREGRYISSVKAKNADRFARLKANR